MKLYPPLGQLGPRAISIWGVRTQAARIIVDGLEHVPSTGPVLLVARHFHHLLDGAVLVLNVPRPIHIVVGLDWAATPSQRRWMERLCRAAHYPIVLRPPTVERTGSYRRDELVAYTRAALRETTRLLRADRVVLVFPEGYPTIDPTGTRKANLDAWLPFAGGVLTMIAHAERDAHTQVAVVPVGFRYERAPGSKRWSIAARIGPALPRRARTMAAIEQAVRTLSGVPGLDSGAASNDAADGSERS